MQKKLFNEADIQFHINKVSWEICKKYEDAEQVYVVFLLAGSLKFISNLFSTPFLSDTSKYVLIGIPNKSYVGTKSCSFVDNAKLISNLSILGALENKDVLLIDDIYDTGKTLDLMTTVIKGAKPKTLRTCVLMAKGHSHEKQVTIDFDNLFVEEGTFPVGYGLDYNGAYRELPYIMDLKLQEETNENKF